jgi:hypothetical protein
VVYANKRRIDGAWRGDGNTRRPTVFGVAYFVLCSGCANTSDVLMLAVESRAVGDAARVELMTTIGDKREGCIEATTGCALAGGRACVRVQAACAA